VLVALLLPALASARARAWGIGCQSNLRQIGLVVADFQRDYNDYFPRHDTAFHRNAVYNFLDYRAGTNIPGRDESRPKGIWICPGDPAPKNYPVTYPNPATNFNQYTFWAWYGKPIYVSYAYNINGDSRTDDEFRASPYGLSAYHMDDTYHPHIRRLSEIQTTSRMMVFVCGWAFRTLAWAGYWLDPDPNTATHPLGTTLKASLLTVDGHAEMVKTEPGDLPKIADIWFRRE